jgi:hypothetical protein
MRAAAAHAGDERPTRVRRLRASLRTIYDWMAEMFEVWGIGAAERPRRSPRPTAGAGRDDARPARCGASATARSWSREIRAFFEAYAAATSPSTRCRRS